MIRKQFQLLLRQPRCLAIASASHNHAAAHSMCQPLETSRSCCSRDRRRLVARNQSMQDSVRFWQRKHSQQSATVSVSFRTYSSTSTCTSNSNSTTDLQGAKHGNKGEEEYLRSVYCARTASAGLREDPIQLHALKYLDRLRRELKQVKPPTQITPLKTAKPQQPSTAVSSSWTSWFGGGGSAPDSTKNNTSTQTDTSEKMPQLPKGCYLHGGKNSSRFFLESP